MEDLDEYEAMIVEGHDRYEALMEKAQREGYEGIFRQRWVEANMTQEGWEWKRGRAAWVKYR